MLSRVDIEWAIEDPLILSTETAPEIRRHLRERTGFRLLVAETFDLFARSLAFSGARARRSRFLFVAFTKNQCDALKALYSAFEHESVWYDKHSVTIGALVCWRTLWNLLMLILDFKFFRLVWKYPAHVLASLYFYHHLCRTLLMTACRVIIVANNSSFEGKLTILAAKRLGRKAVFVPHALLPDDPSVTAYGIDLALCGNWLEEEILVRKGLLPEKCKVVGHLFIDLDTRILGEPGGGVLVCTNQYFDLEMNRPELKKIVDSGKPIRVRFHPTEDRTDHNVLTVTYGFEPSSSSLMEDIRFAAEVYSAYSSAAYVCFLAGRKVRLLERLPAEDTYKLQDIIAGAFGPHYFSEDRRPLRTKLVEAVRWIQDLIGANEIQTTR